MDDKRIHIVGPGGSGKTFAAHALSMEFDLPVYSLDDIFWTQRPGTAGNEPRPEGARVDDVRRAASQRRWIIEGIYTAWVSDAFERATRIYFLDAPLMRRQWRTLTRGIRKGDSWRSLIALLLYNQTWDQEKKPRAIARLEPYRHKVLMVKSVAEIVAVEREHPFSTLS